MFRLNIGILILLFTYITPCNSQSITHDHSSKKASVYSAVLPGSGQFYNKKYWKIPIIYLGISTALYAAKWNQDEYLHYRKAFEYRTDNDDSTVDEYINRYSESNLITIKNYYRKNRDLSYIIAAGIYILNIVDASVDAHLFDFNVSDELSIRLKPGIISSPLNNTPSVSLTLNILK